MKRIIIKPCVPNPQYIELHVTQIESALNPFPYQQTEENKKVSSMMGHATHDILQICAHSEGGYESAKSSAMKMNNHYHAEFSKMLGQYKESVDDKIRFFVHNLGLGTLVDYGLALYDKKIATEVTMGCRVECGEYMVWLSGTCDILMDDGMYDIKYYSKMREGNNLQSEYNNNNYQYSSLAEKIQWYFYPFLFYGDSLDTYSFTYDIFDKKKKMKHERLVCKIPKEWAEKKIKQDIIEYFRIKKQNGQNTEEAVA